MLALKYLETTRLLLFTLLRRVQNVLNNVQTKTVPGLIALFSLFKDPLVPLINDVTVQI